MIITKVDMEDRAVKNVLSIRVVLIFGFNRIVNLVSIQVNEGFFKILCHKARAELEKEEIEMKKQIIFYKTPSLSTNPMPLLNPIV